MARALCFLPAFAFLGCFEVEKGDPDAALETVIVDDFEGQDQLPAPPFLQWTCRAFNPDNDPEAVKDCAFTTDDGQGSRSAFMGDFLLRDVRNGATDFTGASLSTRSIRTFDLRPYRQLMISAKFIAGDPAPLGRIFYAELTCQSARAKGVVGGTSGVTFSVIRQLDLSTPSWFSFRIPITEFRQPPWQESIDGGDQACLARIDGVGLLLSSNLADGEMGGGKLFIDNVSFE
jgi:hypothetical protein